MAIVYPRALPALLANPPRFRFGFTPLGTQSRTVAGAVNFQEFAGGSLWELALGTGPLNESDYGAVHAWFLSLRGGARTFYGYDLRRCWPLAYGPAVTSLMRAGGGAFDGGCSVTAAGGTTLSLSNLPAAYRVSEGDYVSFDWLGGRWLVKTLEAATASSGGAVNNLTVAPWIRAGGTLPAAATLVRAWCEMKPKPGSWSGERTVRDAVSFEAIQTLG